MNKINKLIITTFLVFTLVGCGLPLVSPPKTPEGPSVGKVGQTLTYKTEGTDPLDVHDFMFDWGDDTEPKWKSKETEQSHVYRTVGTFKIMAREKCPLDVFVTDWSKAKTVKIQPKDPVVKHSHKSTAK